MHSYSIYEEGEKAPKDPIIEYRWSNKWVSAQFLKKLHYFCIIYQRKIKQEGFVFDLKMLFYAWTV